MELNPNHECRALWNLLPQEVSVLQASPEQIQLIKSNSPNFSPEELMCKCCGQLNMHADVLTKLQALRNYVKFPLVITSGFRCTKHNAAVGGKINSRHLTGQAVDISLNFARDKKGGNEKGRTAHKFLQMATHLFNGIGVAETFIHCDIREVKNLWHY